MKNVAVTMTILFFAFFSAVLCYGSFGITASAATVSGTAAAAASANKPDDRQTGTWSATVPSMGSVIVITFKNDSTFKQNLAIYSKYSNYAEITKGKYKVKDGKITCYEQTYAKASGYWHSRPDISKLEDIYIEGNLPAADKTETIKIEDNNHMVLDGLEYTRYGPQSAEPPANSSGSGSSNNTAPIKYKNAKYGFTISFPASWKGKYKMVESTASVQVFQKSTYDSSHGRMGKLFSIVFFTPKKWKEQGGNIKSITQNYGVVTTKTLIYYLSGPTDVQYDPGNKKASKEYSDMQKAIPTVIKTFLPKK